MQTPPPEDLTEGATPPPPPPAQQNGKQVRRVAGGQRQDLLLIWVALCLFLPWYRHINLLDRETGRAGLPGELAIWADDTGSATIEQVSDTFWADKFVPIPKPFAQPEPPEGRAHWYRIRLENASESPHSLVIQLGNRDFAEADFYYETQVAGTFVKQTGGTRAGQGWSLAPDPLAFAVELEARSALFAFLRVHDPRGSPKGLGGIYLWRSPEAFESRQRTGFAWTGFAGGILLAALAYHAAVLFGLRQKETTQYLAHLISLGALQLALLVPASAAARALGAAAIEAGQFAALAAMMATLVWFTMRFLEARKGTLPHQLLLCLLVTWIALVPLGALAAFTQSTDSTVHAAAAVARQAHTIALVVSPLVLLATAYQRLLRRSPWAFAYLVSFPAFLSTIALIGWQRLMQGVLTPQTLSAFQAAGALHMVALSSALGLRLHRQRAKDDHARRTYTDRLEQRVRDRTSELNRTTANLAETNAQKDRLLSIIAHDLRSPLNAIVATSDRIARDPGSFSQVETASFAGDIREAALGLRETLENLLNWARLQTNRLTLRPQRFESTPLLQELERLFRAVARDRGVTLELRPSERLLISGDYEAVKTILRNFLSNALKATPRGGKVVLSAYTTANAALLAVRDTGPGMDAKVRASLFRIQSTDTQDPTEERGAGIGLVLCSELAERLAARIEVDSEPGAGSEFRLVVPSPSSRTPFDSSASRPPQPKADSSSTPPVAVPKTRGK